MIIAVLSSSLNSNVTSVEIKKTIILVSLLPPKSISENEDIIIDKEAVMVYENPDDTGNAYCPKCKKRVKVIKKMGGWICSICRRVLLN